jgi:hypothetical protein
MGAGAGVDTCRALVPRRQDSEASAGKGSSGPCALRRQDACAASTPASNSECLWFSRETEGLVLNAE